MEKVSEFYEIDEDELEAKSEESSYWENSYFFYLEVKNKPVDNLSDRQKDWLESIEKELK